MSIRMKIVYLFTLLFSGLNGAAQHPQNIIREEIKIPMRDGVELGAILYRPDEPGKFPAIVLRTPYDAAKDDANMELPRKAAKQGYLVFFVDVRGRYSSEGEFEAYRNEKQDGYDVIEWIGQSVYCNGKVGTYGISYRGYGSG